MSALQQASKQLRFLAKKSSFCKRLAAPRTPAVAALSLLSAAISVRVSMNLSNVLSDGMVLQR